MTEFKVGQQVSGTDYERLPLGSEVKYGDVHVFLRTKLAPNRWARNDRKGDYSDDKSMTHATNATITRVGYADATQPEDATDAYVEPEPLKEGEGWGILARQVGKASHYRFTDGDRVIFDGMAVVEPDGYGFTLKPWVEEPTADYAIVRDGFRTLVRLPIDQRQPGAIYRPWVVVGSDIACAWDDLGEHVVVSGGAS